MTTVIQNLAGLITNQLTGWVGVSDQFIAGLKAPLTAALSLMLVWRALGIVRGVNANMAVLDSVLSTLRVVLVWYGALTAGSYSTNVIGFLGDLRTSLSSAFVPGATSGYQALDGMLADGITSFKLIFSQSSQHMNILAMDFTGFLSAAGGALMLGCMVIFAIVAAFNLLFVDLAVMFLVAVGPLFVACFAFASTTRFFDAWLGACLKYIFTGVMVTAVASLAIGVMRNYASDLAKMVDTWDVVAASFACLGASGVLILFASRAPGLAADITSGIAVHGLGLQSAAGPLGAIATVANRGAKTATNAASYAAGRVAATDAGQQAAASAPGQFIGSIASRASTANTVLSGTAGAAYQAGRGGSVSAGSSTRPVPPVRGQDRAAA